MEYTSSIDTFTKVSKKYQYHLRKKFAKDLCDRLKDHLDEHELKRFLSPSIEQWSDFSNQTHPTFVTLEHAKKKQWNLTRNEIRYVR